MASELELIFILFLGGITFFYMGIKRLRQKKMMESIPTSKIRSLAVGLVEIFGEVLPSKSELLKSPLTSTACVYYRYVVERPGYKRRITVTDEVKWVPFYIKDETGAVSIDPTDAEFILKVDYQLTGGKLVKPSQKTIESFESLNGFLPMNDGSIHKEYLIVPKDNLYVLGRADDDPYVEEGSEIHGVVDMMIQKSRSPNIYEIIDESEKEFLKKATLVIVGGLFGGGAMIVGGIALILF